LLYNTARECLNLKQWMERENGENNLAEAPIRTVVGFWEILDRRVPSVMGAPRNPVSTGNAH